MIGLLFLGIVLTSDHYPSPGEVYYGDRYGSAAPPQQSMPPFPAPDTRLEAPPAQQINMDEASPSTRHFEDPPFFDRSVEETENSERDMTWNQSNPMIYSIQPPKFTHTFCFSEIQSWAFHQRPFIFWNNFRSRNAKIIQDTRHLKAKISYFLL